ncbi:MAG: glycosyltransferase family 2 protein [Deltaproteobacteria bacterium]|nr:glycosyltransferase family 2 protein [Deltaproteobacteria bacterium]
MTTEPATPTRLVSVVVPVFDEARNVEACFEALESVTSKDASLAWEYVFVDDGSRDDSLLLLAKLADAHPKLKVIALARNFGKEIALTAGVTYARGDAVITMDADLQHPPDLIPELVAAWREGADVVVATRRATSRKTLVRRVASRLFAAVERVLASNERIEEGGTDFRLIDKKVRAAFLLVRERRRAYRQIVDWLGFERRSVVFDAAERHGGTSTYSLPKLWNLAIDMLVSRSSMPLRFLLYLGVLITVAAGVSLVWMFFAVRYIHPMYYTPLAQATVFNTLLIGVLLTAVGTLGVYIARIHDEVLGRPLYTVRSTANVPEPEAEPAQRLRARP